MNISVYSKNLLDQSKIRKKLESSSVAFVSSSELIANEQADVYLIDLTESSALDAIENLHGRLTVGFGSHVDIDRMNAATSSGCSLTVPRSRFFARMNEVIDEAMSLQIKGAE